MSIFRLKNRKGKWRYYFVFMHEYKNYHGGGFNSKTEALNAEAKSRIFLISPDKIVFDDACKEYFKHCRESLQQTEDWVRNKERVVRVHFFKYWRFNPISKITSTTIEQVAKNRKSNRDIRILKSIFNFSIRKGWIAKNPCLNLTYKESHRRRHIPPIQDLKKVLAVAKPFDQKLLTILFCTAGRISEVLSLKWDDVTENYLVLKSRKHRYGELRERKIPLSPILKETIDWLRERRKDEWLFHNPRTHNRYLRHPKLMDSLCEKAGVKPFGFHGIRHLAASMLSKENIPVKDVSEYLGHSDISTTQIYLHSLEEGLQEISTRLGEEIR